MNAFTQAQDELELEAYRKKVDRCKELIGQFEQAKIELRKAQEKYDGLDRALESYRKEKPAV